MKKIISFLAVALLLAGLPLSVSAEEEYDWERFADAGITLNVYNWGEYISDGSDDSLDVNAEFEARTGITVNYTNFATNEEMYTKISGGGADYDIIIPSDYMIARMINEDMLEPLDMGNIPNFADIDPSALGHDFDPDNSYSVPYMLGAVCMIYNTTMVEGTPDSWGLMFDETYAGDILMFNNSRDAFAVAQALSGLSLNPQSVDELEQASELLIEQKSNVEPRYVADEIFDALEGGNAAIGAYYAGDANNMIEANPDLSYVFPKEGVNVFVDAMAIPKGSPNKEAAEMYINFMCEAEISAANAEYIYYTTPVMGARELLPAEMLENPLIFIPNDVVANGTTFALLSDEVNAEMDRLWTDIRTAEEDAGGWIMPTIIIVLVLVIAFVYFKAFRKKKKDY